MLLLGVDLGTSALKAAAVTPGGMVRAAARVSYPPTQTRRDGRAEADPEVWWRALRAAVAALGRRVPLRRIAGIGLCGQTRAQVLLDASGRPVRPAILWADRRATTEADDLARAFPPEAQRRAFAYPHVLDATAPLARLLWLRRHEPRALDRAHHVLQPKDFLVYRLTGAWAGDVPASFHLLASHDPPRPTPLLDDLGIGSRLLPPLLPPWQVVAGLSARAARATGLPPGTPVVAGTQDGLASVLGVGATRDGIAVDVTGSADTVGMVAARAPEPGPLAVVPLSPGLFFCGGPTQTTGEAVRWFAHVLASPRAGSGRPPAVPAGDVDEVGRLAARAPAGSAGLLFLPDLTGARAPVWEARARAAFLGLTPAHGLSHLARAVLEGVALSVRHVLEAAETATGAVAGEVRVAGGAGGSAFWNRLKADVLGRTVVQPAVLEAGVLGAALLAAVGVGQFGDPAEAARQMVRVARRHPPGKAAALYDGPFEVFKGLRAALGPGFDRLAPLRGGR